MCGRYTLAIGRQRFEQAYEVQAPLDFMSRFNIAPTQHAPIIRADGDDLFAEMARWGFDLRGQPIINARAETVLEKPLFSKSARQDRIIVPASGWYEWQLDNGSKRPHHLTLEGDDAIAFAGLRQVRADGNRYAIITTHAQPEAAHIHDRMPLILSRERWRLWLADVPLNEIEAMLEPSEQELVWSEVQARVGSPKFDDAELIRPLEREA
jgi:putative SOS response-associated peptidase YedK